MRKLTKDERREAFRNREELVTASGKRLSYLKRQVQDEMPEPEKPDIQAQILQAVRDLDNTLKAVLDKPDIAQSLGSQIVEALQVIQDREIRVLLQSPKREKRAFRGKITSRDNAGRMETFTFKEE